MTGEKKPTQPPLTMRGAPDLGLRWFGFRFVDPGIEQRYRQWDIDRKIPLIRVGMAASASGYAVYLTTVFLLERTSFGAIWPAVATFLSCLGGIFVATYSTRMRSFLIPLTIAANCASGLLLAWQIHDLIGSPDRFALAATAVLIPVMYGFCVYQLSPMQATLAVLPFIGLSYVFLYFDHATGRLSIEMAASMAAMHFIACNTGVFVSAVIEFNKRRTFKKDQIIELQRAALQESRDAIRRYVPQPVADLIISGRSASIDKPVRRRITILFADMVGFTEVSDRIEPEDLTALLIDYLSGMGEIVEKFGGTLNEFAGDGLMAMFGAPYTMAPEEQARQAIAAAREMHQLMLGLNSRWEKLGIGKPLMIRIGINTGTVSVGSYGSKGRMTYTAMGLQTNITSRIEKEAAPGGILISKTTYLLLGGTVPCVPRGEIECRGVHVPVSVCTLAA